MIDISQIKTADQKRAEAENAAKELRVAELKALLLETDYVTLADYDKDKSDILAQRQLWREEMRNIKQSMSKG